MDQETDINLVLQTLTDRLQSPYEIQRKAAKQAIEAMKRLIPFIFPAADTAPSKFTFSQLSYFHRLKTWCCVFEGPVHSTLATVREYAKAPREAWAACVEKIEREIK